MSYNEQLRCDYLTTNHGGAQAWRMTPEWELYSTVVTTMGVEDKFYDKEAQRMDFRDGSRLTDFPLFSRGSGGTNNFEMMYELKKEQGGGMAVKPPPRIELQTKKNEKEH